MAERTPDCPLCGAPTVKENLPDGRAAYRCTACEWGRERVAAAIRGEEPRPAEQRPRTWEWFLLVLGWAATAAIVLGPYYVYTHGWSWIGEAGGAKGALTAPLVAPLTSKYWLWMIVYVGLATAMNPAVFTRTGGFFAILDHMPGWYDRRGEGYFALLMLLLVPGWIVVQTVRQTFVLPRRLIRGR